MRKALFFIVALLTASTAWALNTLTVGDYTFATGSDAEGEYYVVSDTTALNALARYVNSGNKASGMRFKQTANITYTHSTAWNDAASTENNFTGIGSMNMPFSGTFDGGGFTISGIRIYKDGTSNENSYKGLIGNIEDAAAVVKNVTLADARITGHYDVGGIVGYLRYGTVSNCRVTSNVVIHRVQEYSSDHGGITGSASISATIKDCISAATLTDGRGVGAITGSCPTSNVTLLRNYYIYTTCKGIGLVSGSEDRTANDGAVPARFTQSGNTFTIDDASGWEAFCLFLVDGETFSGKTVKLGADISVSRMAGSGDSTPFGGTFDGDGHTLTFNYSGSEDFIAPFSWTTWTASPIFRNLTVSGTINTTGAYAAGLVGHLFGTVTVEHCRSNVDITCASGGSGFVGLCEHTVNFSDCLSSAVIHSKGGNNSGFVGWSRASGYAISFTGCVFNGKLLQIDGEGGINGGFIGWTGSNKTVTITDCLVNTAALADGETMASGSTATFARGWNATTTATNSYYTAALGAPQCTQARSITAGENVTTLENAGTPATVYNVSGITAYPTGIKYNDVLYAGNDETVNLTLGYYDRDGFIFSGYEASAGTLNGSANPYTLTMPDEDVIVGANYTPNPTYFEQTGTNEYIIHTNFGWRIFCDMLNGGETFSGKTVKLGADIYVYGMAGSEDTPFSGTFDGQNKMLVFYCNSVSSDYTAPFRYVKGGNTAGDAATIRNLNVRTTITSTSFRRINMAGLIAKQWGHVNVTDCNVEVNITNTPSNTLQNVFYPAGLVSRADHNENGTLTISGCTVTGTITTTGRCAGGFIGIDVGKTTIENSVSSVIIYSSTVGDGLHGGLIGIESNLEGLAITGCLFNGKILTVGTTDTEQCGGFIGVAYSPVTISNSLYAPADLADGEKMASGNSATFAGQWIGGLYNCYYTSTLGTPQGKQTRSVTAGENVTTLENAGTPATVYNVSGITAYPTGIKYNGVLYAGNGDAVSLTLGHSDLEDYIFNGYEASAGTLSGSANPYTLTMPDEDVTVTALYVPSTIRGDVNGDNAVNIADVTALIDILLSDTTAPAAADCNHDNAVNIADVTSLIDYLLGGQWPSSRL